MTDPQIYRLILAVSIVIAYLPVYRLRTNKYFYFFLVLALIDPVFVVLKWIFTITYYNYFPISTLFILYGLPSKELKYKILATVLVVILLPRLGEQPFLELIITILMYSYITYFFIQDFISEIIKKKTINIFLFLTVIYSFRNTFLIYIYYEQTLLLKEIFVPITLFYFILFILITIVGPDLKLVIHKKEGTNIFDSYHFEFTKENNSTSKEKEIASPWDKLTKTELKILLELSRGVEMKEIAYQQSVKPKTIYSHCKNIRKKFNLMDTNDLVLFAVENNSKIDEISKKLEEN